MVADGVVAASGVSVSDGGITGAPPTARKPQMNVFGVPVRAVDERVGVRRRIASGLAVGEHLERGGADGRVGVGLGAGGAVVEEELLGSPGAEVAEART